MKPFELLALSGSRSSGGAPLSHLQVYRGLTTRAAAVSNAPPFCNKYKEKLSMKNMLSAMALFGVMVASSGSAFAQKGIVVDVDGSGGLKPTVGQNIAFQVHTPQSDAPEIGVKKGTNVCLLTVRNGGQQATVLMNMNCAGKPNLQRPNRMTKVENPKNVDVIKGDKVDVDLGAKTISVSRGNNPATLVKITF